MSKRYLVTVRVQGYATYSVPADSPRQATYRLRLAQRGDKAAGEGVERVELHVSEGNPRRHGIQEAKE